MQHMPDFVAVDTVQQALFWGSDQALCMQDLVCSAAVGRHAANNHLATSAMYYVQYHVTVPSSPASRTGLCCISREQTKK
jgi:hypothetical protein